MMAKRGLNELRELSELRRFANELIDKLSNTENPDSFMEGVNWIISVLDRIEKEGMSDE